ncbi:HemK2/MTQ2 family protein methyltransferase [Rhodococcus sovatensis]|uniref:HemK2/MTQ2 family protein methyltransferase n=1 Tax=Rhodococcus sovatensis TaxID=1805840 RepID=A0ABZ2PMB7_9NOCA
MTTTDAVPAACADTRSGRTMTTIDFHPTVFADIDVYRPQDDSWLLCRAIDESGVVPGARILDMCTGTGIIAIHAAQLGARRVDAFDIAPAAVACARDNAESTGTTVQVRSGSFDEARVHGPYDVVLCNPPYVPSDSLPSGLGMTRAWDAGPEGRHVLDVLCATAPVLLDDGGTLLLVQSEFADPAKTLRMLCDNGFDAAEVLEHTIGYGPVMTSRAAWLEETCKANKGQRTERLVVIRADKR